MEAVFGSAAELAEFGAEGFVPKILFDNGRMKVILASLTEGQEIALHAPQVDLAVAVLQGVGEVWIDDSARPVVPGDLAVIPAGVTRGVRARGGPLVLLHVVSPPPTAADHAVERQAWPAETPGPDVRRSLHEEHQELLPHLDHLRDLADQAQDLGEGPLRDRLKEVLGFLTDTLLAHAAVEEVALYPAVDRLLRATGGGTRTMSIDHQAIGEEIERLAALAGQPASPEARAAIARILGSLEALLRLHFRKEEEAYLPLLARLSAGEAEDLVAALSTAGGEHRHEHGNGSDSR